MADLERAIADIRARRKGLSPQQSLLVGITGIDACGKGYLTRKIAALLSEEGFRVAPISVDGWLNLPQERFHPEKPADQFYEHALRLEEMFQQLILPLRQKRSHTLVMDFAEETATHYRKHTCHFEDVDVILLEGIYLLKLAYRNFFDLAFWVDSSFATALERALERGQEGLSPEETRRAYEKIYFPAQRIHFARDNPRCAADLILPNDPRLAEVVLENLPPQCAEPDGAGRN